MQTTNTSLQPISNSPRTGLKLVHKGLLLVGALLVLELSFLGVLTYLLHEAETDIWKEWHSKKITSQINDLNSSFALAGSTVFMYSITKDIKCKQTFNKQLEQIPESIFSLKRMYAETPQRKMDFTSLDSSSSQVLALLKQVMTVVDGGTTELKFLTTEDASAKIRSSVHKVTSDLEKFASDEKRLLAETPEAETRSRHGVQQWIMLGVCLNLALAIFLAIWFTRGISSRLAVLTDNTERLARHQDLNTPLAGTDEIAHLDSTFHKMAEDLSAVDKLKREFSAMITHDLRAPLASALSNLAFITSGMDGDISESVSNKIQRVERSCSRLLNLVNDLLDLDKLEEGKLSMSFDTVRTADVIERSIEAVQGLSSKQEVQIRSTSSDLEIFADPERLTQVLINLLSNAIKFSPKKSTIEITAQTIPGWLEFRVSDQGKGIPREHLDRIFDRFQQVELDDAKLKGGSGLGLAICKAIVEEHHGEIGVESEEGKGSTFWIRIPSIQAGRNTRE